MTYMTPGNAAYLDALRQLNPLQGGIGGGGVGGTAVGSPVSQQLFANPLGAGPVSGNIPGLSAPNVVADVAANAPDAIAAGGGGAGPFGGLGGIMGMGAAGAAEGAGGLSLLGTAGRIAGIGARGAAADAGMTGLGATGYSMLPLGIGIGTDIAADRALKAAGLQHKSLLADVGKGALGGAAAGTAAGLLGGPFAEITVPVGAGVGGLGGAVVGGISHLFGGGGKQQQQVNFGRETTSLLDQAKQAGLDPQTASDLYNQYGIYLRTQLATTRGTDQEQASRQDAYQKLAGNIQTALQYQTRQQARQQSAVPGFSNMGPQDYAALQALGAAYIKPYTDQSIATDKQEYGILSGLADKIGGPTGDAIKAQATAAQAAGDRTAMAYASQVQMAPTMFGFQQQQSQMQALASQLQSQAIANYLQQGPYTAPTFDWSSGGGVGGLGGLSGILPTTGSASKSTTAKKLP